MNKVTSRIQPIIFTFLLTLGYQSVADARKLPTVLSPINTVLSPIRFVLSGANNLTCLFSTGYTYKELVNKPRDGGQDAHDVTRRFLATGDTSDWSAVSSGIDANVIEFSFSRPRDTGYLPLMSLDFAQPDSFLKGEFSNLLGSADGDANFQQGTDGFLAGFYIRSALGRRYQRAWADVPVWIASFDRNLAAISRIGSAPTADEIGKTIELVHRVSRSWFSYGRQRDDEMLAIIKDNHGVPNELKISRSALMRDRLLFTRTWKGARSLKIELDLTSSSRVAADYVPRAIEYKVIGGREAR